jgi:hypothetical protein
MCFGDELYKITQELVEDENPVISCFFAADPKQGSAGLNQALVFQRDLLLDKITATQAELTSLQNKVDDYNKAIELTKSK